MDRVSGQRHVDLGVLIAPTFARDGDCGDYGRGDEALLAPGAAV